MTPSRSAHYNYFKEKLMLQEEEKVLKEMLGKFQDQLNRLKIEELALLSLIKMQEEQSNCHDASKVRQKQNTVRSLDSVSDNASSISSVLPVGLVYENAADMNKEFLDLDVGNQVVQDNQYDHTEEEEEEDESDEIEDDMVSNDYTNQLRSYMEDL